MFFSIYQAPPEGSPTGGLCPKGGYCPQGAKTPEPCPVGKYSGTKGNKEPDDCVTCDPGYGNQKNYFSRCFVFLNIMHLNRLGNINYNLVQRI